ncbi:MAG: nucleotide pyrophosphohydrolase [Anaerolineae bacterium]|jgi:NTP pyrophosphatase (non-canonical NTP hydrolase)
MDITELQREVNEFVREMGWYDEGSPHPQTPRNLAISLTLEAAEVLEHFQWSDDFDRDEVALELADVFHYVLQLSAILGVDLEQAVMTKLAQNRGRRW